MKIILASGSPRRRELLAQAGYEFEIRVSDADENVSETNPAKLVEQLSYRKAKAVAEEYIEEMTIKMGTDCKEDMAEPCIIIGSDTVVALGEEVLGKPKDEEDAKRMLLELSDHTHQVYTGVSLLKIDPGDGLSDAVSFHECTDVHMRKMEEEEILQYIASGEPMDKAGAYGIQGKAAIFISGIDGDYYNVVGLPICRLVTELRRFL